MVTFPPNSSIFNSKQKFVSADLGEKHSLDILGEVSAWHHDE